MEKHHEQAIQYLREMFQNDPRYPALIISGSIAHGNASPASDVDVLLVANDEYYQQLTARNERIQIWREGCNWPDGYFDVKIVNYRFLLDAADHGAEPIRYALQDAYPAYSHIPGLEDLLQRITVYPEHEREQKLQSYYAQVLLYKGYFIRTATVHNNIYLLHRTANQLVLFAGKLLLAYNHALFPSHKWLLDAVEHLEDRPADFIPLAEQLLQQPSIENAEAFGACIVDFRDWGIDYMQALNHFVEDDEWTWFTGKPALADW